MKPPVEAPTSRAAGPFNGQPKVLQRRGQLPPTAADVLDRAAAKLDLRLVTDTPPRTRLDSPSDIGHTVPHELTGRAAAARQAAVY